MKNLRLLFLLSVALVVNATAQSPSSLRWVGSWAASQQIPTGTNALGPNDLASATLRQIVHLSLGGDQLRIRLANTFGTAPLHLVAVHIARPKSPADSAIDTSTDRAITFDSGKPDVTIPAGAEYLSDPVAFHATPLSDVAITMQYAEAPSVQTSHPGSRSTSYLSHTVKVDSAEMPDAVKFDHWFQISGVDVPAAADSATVVALGDSITDGHGATTNGNDRWPDDLAVRLQSDAKLLSLGVLNQGLGGNRILLDGQGPNALARFDRDVVAQPGVKYVIVFEGVNDLGMSTKDSAISPAEHEALTTHVIAALQQMIDRAHAHGLKIYGATITPYGGFAFYHPDASNEADRQKINAWIRRAGHFDAVLDFDKVVADPANPAHLLPAFDSGDHIHPNAVAYHKLAESIPLQLFVK